MQSLLFLVLFKINFSYERLKCNNCHDLLQISMTCDDVANVTVGTNDYRI